MSHIRLSAVALALLLPVSACGGSEEAADETPAVVDSAAMQRAAARTIHAGMSQEEVRNKLGEPRTRVTMDGGFERWTYYNYNPEGQIAAKTLIIFGRDGEVVEVNDI